MAQKKSRRREERGVSSLWGLLLLGILLFVVLGMGYAEKAALREAAAYETEVRLTLFAKSGAERAAAEFLPNGARAGTEPFEGELVLEDLTEDALTCRRIATFSDGELVLTALAEADGDGVFPAKSYRRARLRMKRREEGDGYAVLGVLP